MRRRRLPIDERRIDCYLEGFTLHRKHIPIVGGSLAVGGVNYEVLWAKSCRLYNRKKRRKKRFLGWNTTLYLKKLTP